MNLPFKELNKGEKQALIIICMIWFCFWYWAIGTGHREMFKLGNKAFEYTGQNRQDIYKLYKLYKEYNVLLEYNPELYMCKE